MQTELDAARVERALEIVDEAMRSGPESVDVLLLRAMCFARAGDREGVARCRELAAALLRQRLDGIEAMLSAPVAAGARSTPPTPGPASVQVSPAVPPGGAAGTADTGSWSESPAAPPTPAAELERLTAAVEVPDARERKLAAARLELAASRMVAEAEANLDGGDASAADARFEAVLRSAERRPEIVGSAVIGMTASKSPRVVAAALEALVGVLDELVAAAIAAFDAGEEVEGNQRQELALRVASILCEHRREMPALRGMRAWADSPAPRLAAAGLRAMAAMFERWAARIEATGNSPAEFAAESERFLVAADELHGSSAAMPVVEQTLWTMRDSPFRSFADGLRERLRRWAGEHVRVGRTLVGTNQKAAAMALARAWAIDSSAEQEGLDAARLFEQAAMLGQAVRIYKRLAATGGAVVANVSRQRLEELQAAAQPVAAALEPLTGVPTSGEAMRARVETIRTRLPILEGPELDVIDGFVEQGNFVVASSRLSEAIAAVRTGGIRILPTTGGRPHQGDAFRLGEVELAFRWLPSQPGIDSGLGFWACTTNVAAGIWSSVVRNAIFQPKDETGGYPRLSWNNAMLFCAELNVREQQAGRLPPGYAYSLPMLAQLERMADAQGRVMGARSDYLWVLEPGELLPGREPSAQARATAGREILRYFRFNPPGESIGFLVVLAPVADGP
ncbi:MAG: hypothetical protein JNN13_20105 [Planctomycetes bacterium]|nr:hypothetical protein [Planctomycetota bacterium]MBZ0151383.1 hypothetical protein [Planctomycetota bacterium]MCC7399312.1 hypothetical protein [Planctomycetota bacterium]